jgi:hypothetical protein
MNVIYAVINLEMIQDEIEAMKKYFNNKKMMFNEVVLKLSIQSSKED